MVSFWHDKIVMVTGATGLLGSWLTKRLIEYGAKPVCLVRDCEPQSESAGSGHLGSANLVRGDINATEVLERSLAEYEVEVVFHLAAQAIVGVANQDPTSTFETNIRGTWNMLEACRKSPGVKAVVVASSDKAYGDQSELPYREDMPLKGLHPYEVSKSCADLIAQTYAHTYALPVGITRCGNFFGGGDLNWNRVVPGTIRSVIRGERPIIRSDGQYVRDYLYVEDGAAANMLLAERLLCQPEIKGQAFNFSHEVELTVAQLVQKILDQMGSDLTPEIQNQPLKEIRRQYLSADRARELLDWTPEFTLDEGLERTIFWYRELLSEPVRVGRPANAL